MTVTKENEDGTTVVETWDPESGVAEITITDADGNTENVVRDWEGNRIIDSVDDGSSRTDTLEREDGSIMTRTEYYGSDSAFPYRDISVEWPAPEDCPDCEVFTETWEEDLSGNRIELWETDADGVTEIFRVSDDGLSEFTTRLFPDGSVAEIYIEYMSETSWEHTFERHFYGADGVTEYEFVDQWGNHHYEKYDDSGNEYLGSWEDEDGTIYEDWIDADGSHHHL